MAIGFFFGTPAHGHINPTLPLVKRLVKNGDTIIYYATPEYKEKIENAGAKFKSYKHLLINHKEPDFNIIRLALALLTETKNSLPYLLGVVEKENCDYIIHDSLSIWGWIIAKKLKLPSICSTTTFAINKSVIKSIYINSLTSRKTLFSTIFPDIPSIIKSICVKNFLNNKYDVKLSLLEVFSNFSDITLVFTSKMFQPFSNSFDSSFKFIGTSITDIQQSDDFSLDNFENKKVIYISLGTLVNDRLDFYKNCINAFSKSNYIVIISIGTRININDLGNVSPNFIIKTFVPQIKVLKKADVFITHGGMNSVHEGLLFGVPLLLFPQTEEQLFVSKRVAELKAGIVMKESNLKPFWILKQTKILIENAMFKNSAVEIGQSLKISGSHERAYSEIQNFKNRKNLININE